MKLVQIDHHGHCRVVASTYLWAPDTLTAERFRADLVTAQEAYRTAADAAATFAGPRPAFGGRTDGWVTAGSNQPDSLTLGEIREGARQAQAEYSAWTARRDAAMRPFSAFMADLGYRPFGQPDPAFSGGVFWGRTWDSAITAEQTSDPGSDLPGSLRQREIQVPVPESEALAEGAYTLETEEYLAADPTEASTPVLPRDLDD